jgi:hypothetical protein
VNQDIPQNLRVRNINNSRTLLPFVTFFLVIFLVLIFIWFFRGGSFRLYASIFFSLYNLTGQIWISVLLIGIFQNVAFLPLRFIGQFAWPTINDFEEALQEKNKEDSQYFVFRKKITEGSLPFVFYIFNFVINAIAFFSAGRIFLIDFYTTKLNPAYLYHFVKYPQYPLLGTDFHFPFFKITQTYSFDWWTIAKIWIGITLFFAVTRLLWQPFKWIFGKNIKLLSARIKVNHLLLKIGGFGVPLILISMYVFRHIPTAFQGFWLIADLTHQNTIMNTITAIGTFLTFVHAGYTNNSKAADNALKNNIPPDIVNKVFKEKMRTSIKNAVILGLGAFFITNQIPSAFELSVAMFELLYILSPYTFDRLLKINTKKIASMAG